MVPEQAAEPSNVVVSNIQTARFNDLRIVSKSPSLGLLFVSIEIVR